MRSISVWFTFFTTVIHELSHALAAKAVRLRVTCLIIGGKAGFKKDCVVVLLPGKTGSSPLEGLCHVDRDVSGFPAMVLHLAGFLGTLAFLLVLFTLLCLGLELALLSAGMELPVAFAAVWPFLVVSLLLSTASAAKGCEGDLLNFRYEADWRSVVATLD